MWTNLAIRHEVFSLWPPPCGQCRYDTLCLLRLMLKYAVSDLDGLPEAAPSQHLSVDEVGRPEDAVRPLGHHAQWFWSTYVLLTGAWRLVNAVAATGGLQAKIPMNGEKKKEKHNLWCKLGCCLLLQHLQSILLTHVCCIISQSCLKLGKCIIYSWVGFPLLIALPNSIDVLHIEWTWATRLFWCQSSSKYQQC